MTSAVGKFTILDIGKDIAKYFWNGKQLDSVTGIFVNKKMNVTIYTTDKHQIPSAEMIAYGYRVKEVK